MEQFTDKYGNYLVILSSIFGLLLPILLYLTDGQIRESISIYHFTDARWVLFGMLIMISLGFFTGPKEWQLSGILLICISIVNVTHRWEHNMFAALFFLNTTRIMVLDKRYYPYVAPILISLGLYILDIFNLYDFEIIGIFTIVVYNINYIYIKSKIKNKS